MAQRYTGLPANLMREDLERSLTGLWDSFAPRVLAGRPFPAVNVWEEDDAFVLEAEVPGIRPENLEITVVGSEVTIRGQRPEPAQNGATYHRRERGVGTFTRVLRLPADIDADNVQARLENGVLELRLPKHPSAKPRKIQVAASDQSQGEPEVRQNVSKQTDSGQPTKGQQGQPNKNK